MALEREGRASRIAGQEHRYVRCQRASFAGHDKGRKVARLDEGD
jgi:hypothetical protein